MPGVSEALESLWTQGIREALVQPTHILYGHEYDKIKAEMAPWQGRFDTLFYGFCSMNPKLRAAARSSTAKAIANKLL